MRIFLGRNLSLMNMFLHILQATIYLAADNVHMHSHSGEERRNSIKNTNLKRASILFTSLSEEILDGNNKLLIKSWCFKSRRTF